MSLLIERDTCFVALTRPQMFAGVTYSYFVANAVVATELFLILKSAWVLAGALLIHAVGVLLCLKEPRIFDLWLARRDARASRITRSGDATPTAPDQARE
jgi:type IV secretion system protein VirB3